MAKAHQLPSHMMSASAGFHHDFAGQDLQDRNLTEKSVNCLQLNFLRSSALHEHTL